MYRSDEDTLTAAREVLGLTASPSPLAVNGHADPPETLAPLETDIADVAEPAPAPPSKRQQLVILGSLALGLIALVGLALLLSGTGGGSDGDAVSVPVPTSASSAPTDLPPAAPAPASPAPAVGAITVEGELLGPIGRTIVANGGTAVAYPGQPVTAPQPLQGQAVAWQWELCDPSCTIIGGATEETWTSPPTPTPVHVRVVVQVDLDGAHVRVASQPYQALPWPEDGTTAEPSPPTAAASAPPTDSPAVQASPTEAPAADPPAAEGSPTEPAAEPQPTADPLTSEPTATTVPG